MNYLITTFDGFGDGVIYYPVFREIGDKMSKSKFFYTSNLFFSDSDIRRKINLPLNFRVVGNEFRKLAKENWEITYDFLENHNIKKVINLRFIGKKFEKDYYGFKQWVNFKNSDIVFFDDENLRDEKMVNINARNIILLIIEKAFNVKLSYSPNILKQVFPPNKQSDSILINVHSRGVFKLWEANKWAELISSLALSNKEIKICEGFGDIEKSYVNKVVRRLQPNIKNKIEIIKSSSLGDIIGHLRGTFLLISIDSGLIHFADSIEINSLGIYLTTSPKMWGGVTNKFRHIESNHMYFCKNFYPHFGMCMNNKIKCEEISNGRDDILVSDVLKKIDPFFL